MYSIFEDIPYKDYSLDRYNRTAVAEVISTSIIRTMEKDHSSVCYGIYGKWGEGKTTVLNFIEQKIREKQIDKLKIVRFNPWLIKNQERMLTDFIRLLTKDYVGEVKAALNKYGDAIAVLSGTMAGIVSLIAGHPEFSIPISSKVKSAVKWIPKLWNGTRQVVNAYDDSSVEILKERVSEELRDGKHHILVLIDDIDRLDKEEIHCVFRTIRQVADFDNVIYVVALDPSIVAGALKGYYGDDFSDGKQFLEKIIQVPILLPKVQISNMKYDIRLRMHDLLSEYNVCDEKILQEIVDSIWPILDTPRQIVRYVNQVNLVLPAIHKEVNIVHLCLLEAIKLIDFSVYQMLYDNWRILMKKESYINSYLNKDKEKEEVQKRYDRQLGEIQNIVLERYRECVTKIIKKLFDENSFLYGYNNRGVNSSLFYPIYFMQSVPQNMIPPSEQDKLSESLLCLTKEQLVQWIDQNTTRYNSEEVKRVLQDLVLRVDDFKQRCSYTQKVVTAIALSSLSTPSQESERFGLHSIACFMSNLVKQSAFTILEAEANPIYDSETISNICNEIFLQKNIYLCLEFNSQFNQFYNHLNKEEQRKYILPLIERFKRMTFAEQMQSSKSSLWALYVTWNNLEENAARDYLLAKLNSNDFNPEEFILHFIDKDKGNPRDTEFFILIFKEGAKKLAESIGIHKDNPALRFAVSSVLSNYNTVIANNS